MYSMLYCCTQRVQYAYSVTNRIMRTLIRVSYVSMETNSKDLIASVVTL